MILLNMLYNGFNINEKFSNEEKKDNDIGKGIYLYLRDYNPTLEYKDLTISDIFLIALIWLISLIISFYAAYLSISCTWNGLIENMFLRFIFALCAFLLGPIYLLWYFIVNWLFRGCNKG